MSHSSRRASQVEEWVEDMQEAAHEVMREASPNRRAAGRTYYRAGHILEVKSESEDRVSARVRGSRAKPYTATLFEDGTYHCDCPSPMPCKHLVALAAHIQERGLNQHAAADRGTPGKRGHSRLVFRIHPSGFYASVFAYDPEDQVLRPLPTIAELPELILEHMEGARNLYLSNPDGFRIPYAQVMQVMDKLASTKVPVLFLPPNGMPMIYTGSLPVELCLAHDAREFSNHYALVPRYEFEGEYMVAKPGQSIVVTRDSKAILPDISDPELDDIDDIDDIQEDELFAHQVDWRRRAPGNIAMEQSFFQRKLIDVPPVESWQPAPFYRLLWPEITRRLHGWFDRSLDLDDVYYLHARLGSGAIVGLEDLPAPLDKGPAFCVSLYPENDGGDQPLVIGRLSMIYAAKNEHLKARYHEARLDAQIEELRTQNGTKQKVSSSADSSPTEPAFAHFPPKTIPLYRRRYSSVRVIDQDENEAIAARSIKKEAKLLKGDLPLKCTRSTGLFQLGPRKIRTFLEETLPKLKEAQIPVRIHRDLVPMLQGAFRSMFQIEQSSGQDWFAGRIEINGLGPADRALLLRAAREKKEFARLESGAWVRLEDLGLERLTQSLERMGLSIRADGTVARIESGEAAALLFELRQALEVKARGHMQAFLSNLRGLADETTPAPSGRKIETQSGLKGELRPYQREGAAFFHRLHELGTGGILADDMGLGKTVQSLVFIASLHRRAKGTSAPAPALLVGPLAALEVWRREAERFVPGLPVTVWHGSGRIDSELPADGLILTTFGVAIRDAEILQKTRFRVVLVDEAQNVKNPRSRAYRVLHGLKADALFCLTGTPLENHLGELHALMDLSFPGLLGKRAAFKKHYGTGGKQVRGLDDLRRRIAPFLLRRTKAQVLSELPPLTESSVAIPMSEKQTVLYEQARRKAVRELKNAGRDYLMKMLPHLTRLRRIACHPHLEEADTSDPLLSGKMQYLSECLDELGETASGVLIFSQFTDVLKMAGRVLTNAGHEFFYLTGSTTAGARTKMIDAFQAGTKRFFLISLKAGGTALTLHRADTVIHLDPWWNPAAERQATDRAHRIGQRRAVFMYRLYARGTVEEKVVALQDEKRRLFQDLFGEGTGGGAEMSREDLLALLQE